MNSKTLVLMSDNRKLLSNLQDVDYNSLTAVINFNYAKKNKYDFLYLNPILDGQLFYNCVSPTNNLRHPSWSKILSVLKIIKEYQQYEQIIYIDSDCIFKNQKMTIKEYLESIKNVEKNNLDLNNDIYFMNNQPWNYDLPCAGFFIVKNNEKTNHFFNLWFNDDTNNLFDIKHPWEQITLQFSLFKNKEQLKIELIDDWMFREKENQFIRHIGSEEDRNRIPFFKSEIYKLGLVENFTQIIDEINTKHLIQFNT
jgi:hypothetical protein